MSADVVVDSHGGALLPGLHDHDVRRLATAAALAAAAAELVRLTLAGGRIVSGP